jgi:hypothetical protein
MNINYTNYKNSPMVSLYEFRGKPDHDGIGKKIHGFAKLMRVKTGIRTLPPNYPYRQVMLYPASFLQEYFNLKKYF